jgi:hypothetical protein
MGGAFSELVDPNTGATISHWTQDGFAEADGSSGTMRWTQDFSGTTHWLDSDHAKAVAATDSWIERRGWCAANSLGASLERRSLSKDGRNYNIVRALPHGGVSVEM